MFVYVYVYTYVHVVVIAYQMGTEAFKPISMEADQCTLISILYHTDFMLSNLK